jgi:hypothetical protein
MQKHFYFFICVLSTFCNVQSANAQKLDYGLMGKVNVSSIYGPSRDSFNSAAAFGASFFIEEKLKSTNISIALQPGYSQVAYISEFNSLSYKSRNIELPIQFYITPKNTEKTRLFGGVITSMQIAKVEEIPTGSNVNGLNSKVLKETNVENVGLTAGVDFQISKGFNLSFGYNHQLQTNYKKDGINNRPSQIYAALQFRFVDFAERNNRKDTLTNILGNTNALCVLLPTNQAEIKRWFNNEEIVLADFQQTLMSLYTKYYTATPLVFIADTAMNHWPSLKNKDIIKSTGNRLIEGNNDFAIVKVGSYFVSGARDENDGLFLLNQNLEVVNSPFLGFYKINFLRSNSPTKINEGLTLAIIKMNKQLESIPKQENE